MALQCISHLRQCTRGPNNCGNNCCEGNTTNLNRPCCLTYAFVHFNVLIYFVASLVVFVVVCPNRNRSLFGQQGGGWKLYVTRTKWDVGLGLPLDQENLRYAIKKFGMNAVGRERKPNSNFGRRSPEKPVYQTFRWHRYSNQDLVKV
jgi:hypothetical protein